MMDPTEFERYLNTTLEEIGADISTDDFISDMRAEHEVPSSLHYFDGYHFGDAAEQEIAEMCESRDLCEEELIDCLNEEFQKLCLEEIEKIKKGEQERDDYFDDDKPDCGE